MRQIWRDGIAAIVVASLVISYLGLILNGTIGQLGGMTLMGNTPVVDGPRAMAAIGLMVVGALWLLSGPRVLNTWSWLAGGVAALTLGVGLTAVASASWVLLAAFIVAIVAMWATLTLHDIGEIPRHAHRAGAARI